MASTGKGNSDDGGRRGIIGSFMKKLKSRCVSAGLGPCVASDQRVIANFSRKREEGVSGIQKEGSLLKI